MSKLTLQKFINKKSKDLANSLKSSLSKAGKGDSKLYRKIKVVGNVTGTGVTMTISMPGYATFVDEGRRKGKQPPIKFIKEWCNRKGIDNKMAFPIARKIGRDGIPETNFLDPLREFRKDIIPQVQEQVFEITKKMTKTELVDPINKQFK